MTTQRRNPYVRCQKGNSVQLNGNTVLITGGATGIGLALASELLRRNNTVIICGRNEAALERAQADNPGLHTRAADVSTASGRKELVQWLADRFPQLNVVVNNAGIQRQFLAESRDVAVDFERNNEIETNLTAECKRNEDACTTLHGDGSPLNGQVLCNKWTAAASARHSPARRDKRLP
jgi:short-subunit dehydrogenase involved in D-alanine esterification of teichoic acids